MWVSWVTLGPTPGGGYRSRCQYSTKAPLSAYYRTVPAVTATYRDGGPPSCQDRVAWNGTAHRCAFWDCCHPDDVRSAAASQAHLLRFLQARLRWMDENIDRPF